MQVFMPSGIALNALLLTMVGGENDLLDYVPSKDYWQAKGVVISVDNMLSELKAKGETASNPAASARRLMAIRTLGELKKEKAASALKGLQSSKRPFVADYAACALASIAGKPYKRSGPSKSQLQKHLGLMPENCGIIGQAAAAGIFGGKTGSISFEKVFDMVEDIMGPMASQINADQLRSQYVNAVVGLAEQTGNIRLNSVTLGVSDIIDNDKGFVVLTASGIYNSKAIKNLLTPMAEETETVNGIRIFSPESEVGLLLPSDESFIFVGAPTRDKLPLREVTSAFISGRKGLEEDAGVKKLLGSIETGKSPLWAVAKISSHYHHGLDRELPFLSPLEWITLTTGQEKERPISFTLKAAGDDARALSQAAMQFNGMLQEGIAALKETIEKRQESKGVLSPYLDLLESIKLQQEGKEVTVKGVWKGSGTGSMAHAFITNFVHYISAGHQTFQSSPPPSSAAPYQPGQSKKKAVPSPSNP